MRRWGLMLLLLQTGLILQTLGETYPSEISKGFYLDELSPPILYSTFLPIIHEYKYPTWNMIDMTLRDWRTTCQTHDFAPSYTCPVFFYLERFIERLQLELVSQNTRKFAQQVPAEVRSLRDKCNRVQRHFNSILTSRESMNEYIQSWKQCPVQGAVVREDIQDYVYNIKELYKNMLTKYENEFSQRASSGVATDRVGPGIYVNHITSSQGLMMFNYWVEHSRWESATRACAAGQIPTTLIKPANLTSALKEVEDEAGKHKYVLSIPMNETGTYLDAPLTDCTFSEDSSFTVRTLVPILDKSNGAKLVQLQPIPFLLNFEDTYSVCQIFDAQGTFLHDPVSGYLSQSDCRPGELCQVQNPSRIPLPNLCASAYFSGSGENIKKYCKFQCERVIDDFYPKLPIVRQVASNKFIVTGNSALELVIKCEGKRDQLVNPGELGSLEITLPCHCSLNFRAQVFLPEQPCGGGAGETASIKLIMPLQFFNDEFLAGNNETFVGTLEKGMMEPQYFSKGGDGNNKKSTSSDIDVQTDVESGRVESIVGGASNNNNNNAAGEAARFSGTSSSSTVGIWTVLIIQGLIIIGLLVFFVKRSGFSSFPRPKWGDSGPPRMSFSNPLASDSQVDITSGGGGGTNNGGSRDWRNKRRSDEDQFDI